jgi:hypothetical protein
MLDLHTLGGPAAQAISTFIDTLVAGVILSLAQDASKAFAKSAYRRFLRAPIKRGDL